MIDDLTDMADKITERSKNLKSLGMMQQPAAALELFDEIARFLSITAKEIKNNAKCITSVELKLKILVEDRNGGNDE